MDSTRRSGARDYFCLADMILKLKSDSGMAIGDLVVCKCNSFHSSENDDLLNSVYYPSGRRVAKLALAAPRDTIGCRHNT